MLRQSDGFSLRFTLSCAKIKILLWHRMRCMYTDDSLSQSHLKYFLISCSLTPHLTATLSFSFSLLQFLVLSLLCTCLSLLCCLFFFCLSSSVSTLFAFCATSLSLFIFVATTTVPRHCWWLLNGDGTKLRFFACIYVYCAMCVDGALLMPPKFICFCTLY